MSDATTETFLTSVQLADAFYRLDFYRLDRPDREPHYFWEVVSGEDRVVVELDTKAIRQAFLAQES